MPRGIVRPVSGIWSLVAIIAISTIAVLLGWSISEGMTGLPIYVLQSLALFSFVVVSPPVGLTFFFLIVHALAFIPLDILLPGSTTEFYVFGLSAANVVLLVLVLAWWMRFMVVQREFLPMGPVGKILIVSVVFGGVNLLRSIIIRAFLNTSGPDTIVNYLSMWRTGMIVPIFAFMVLNTHIGERTFKFVLWSYVVLISVGILVGFAEVLEYVGDPALKSRLSEAPLDLALMTPTIITVALYMAAHTRSIIARLLWVVPLILMVLPVAYLHRRGSYSAVVLQGVLTFLYLLREKKSHKATVILLLIGAVAGLVYYMPQTIIDRVMYSFYDPTGKERLDPSIGIRFTLWTAALKRFKEDWWITLIGLGFDRSVTISRQAVGSGLSLHNAYLADVADGGVVLLGIHLASLVILFRTFRFMAKSSDLLVRAFAVALMISLIAAQPWYLFHGMSFAAGQYMMMLWFIASLVTIQMRPGGMFADVQLRDGRLGRELLGYPRQDQKGRTGKTTEDMPEKRAEKMPTPRA